MTDQRRGVLFDVDGNCCPARSNCCVPALAAVWTWCSPRRHPKQLAELRRSIGADDAVTESTNSSDAGEGKPAPDIVQVALERTGLPAAEAVFVGDAVWDGVACGRAGVTFVGLTCGGTPETELREAGAVEAWRDPAHLLDNLDDSAIGRL